MVKNAGTDGMLEEWSDHSWVGAFLVRCRGGLNTCNIAIPLTRNDEWSKGSQELMFTS